MTKKTVRWRYGILERHYNVLAIRYGCNSKFHFFVSNDTLEIYLDRRWVPVRIKYTCSRTWFIVGAKQLTESLIGKHIRMRVKDSRQYE